MGTEITVRAATSEDAAAVQVLAVQLRDADDKGLPDITLAWVEHYLEQSEDDALVAEVDDAAVGLLTYRIHEDLFHGGLTALIEELVVDEAWRGRGVGTALLGEALRVFRERGCVGVGVNTGCDNTGAQALYKRMGFTHESLMLGTHFGSDGEPIDG